MDEPEYNEIRKRLSAIHDQRRFYEPEFEFLSHVNVRNFFPMNIGFHSLLGQTTDRAERIKEIANICIHGCPDCISIGNKCSVGSYKEKYHVSKSLLDEYIAFLTIPIRLPHSTSIQEIEEKLKQYGVIVLFLYTKQGNREQLKVFDDKRLRLVGKPINKKYIKFAGFWVETNVDRDDPYYQYCAMLVTI